jgi:pimeloyl-ACP methyl ester carboxylesterase
VDFAQYGNKDGQLVVYFHGAPGGVEECSIFDSDAKTHNLNVICFDRFAIDSSLDRKSYYQDLANQICIKACGKPIDLVGFSVGAHVALEVSAILNDQVRQTHLIAAAAPLNAGDFIEKMAGGLVFEWAKKRPFIFLLLTQYQRILALLAPKILFNILFASAIGKDKVLSKQKNFRRYITPVLQHCFKSRTSGYMRDINYYVTWQGDLDSITSSVYIWHGTEDNWAPYSMALYLFNAIPGALQVESMEGLSHYSCLHEAAPKICKILS